jgi:hypothetical protein
MNTTFKTFADAEKAGFEKVNRGNAIDISGGNSYGYQFEELKTERKSVIIYATEEKNRMTKGLFNCFYPPKNLV